MEVLDCLQGSPSWHEARLARPTASQFSRIVTPTGKLSAQREQYLAELVCEWALGYPYETFMGNEATSLGHQIEPEAFSAFELVTDVELRKIGVCYRDEAREVACSPDAMVLDDDGAMTGEGVEIKSHPFSPAEHLVWLFRDELPKKHIPQCQGCIWVCQAPRWYFMSYVRGLPPLIKVVEPDPKYQAALDAHMPEFIAELLAGRERLEALGVQPNLPHPAQAAVADTLAGSRTTEAGAVRES